MTEATLSAALEYIDRGWSVIPIRAGTKKPVIGWKEYQDRQPTEAECIEWFENTDCDIAIVCGRVSNLVVVDTDDETATKLAADQGWDRTPYRVKTRKGYHYYFSTDTRIQKGKIADKVDLQAEASYVLAPPSTDKTFVPLAGCDPDDLPVYSGPLAGTVVGINTHEDYEDISLDNIKIREAIWDATEKFVAQNGKLAGGVGHNCHNRLVSLVGECASAGYSPEETYDHAQDFMSLFMADPFDDPKVWGVIKDIYRNELKKEPDNVQPIKEETPEPDPDPEIKLITTQDIDRLEEYLGDQTFYVDPIIPSNDASLTMVFGFSGHGKSMFTRNMLYSACCEDQTYGPFILQDRPRVLYLDLENGRRNITKFLNQAKATYGDAGSNFMMFAPFEGLDMNLKSEAGIKLLRQVINQTRPNIVCIDTIRSAFPGIIEKEGSEWASVNALIMKLRNYGISVILVHHANKPQDGGQSGSFAGSTNAMTNLEFQIKITQVFDEQDKAVSRAGIYTGDVEDANLLRLQSPAALKDGERMAMLLKIQFTKNREADESLEDVSYMGFASNYDARTFRPVSVKTPKQRAMYMARPHALVDGTIAAGLSDLEIARKLDLPLNLIKDWLAIVRKNEVAPYISNQIS